LVPIDSGKYYGPNPFDAVGFDPDTGRPIRAQNPYQPLSGSNDLAQETGAGGLPFPDGLQDAHPAAKVLWALQNDLVPHLKGVPPIDEHGAIHPAYTQAFNNNGATVSDNSQGNEAQGEGFLSSSLKYAKDFLGGSSDFIRNYEDMRDANTIGADKYFHCKANCEATQRGPGGQDASILIGEGREYADEYLKGDSREDCDADRAANKIGRDGASTGPCEEVCAPLRPPYLDEKY
jgi:hypothetical protein